LKITRREFLTLAGTTAAGLLLTGCGGPAKQPVEDKAHTMKAAYDRQITTICPYCGVGCGAIVVRKEKGGKVLSIEGDPDHPINEGSLCSKGSALYQVHFTHDGKVNPNRLLHVQYRAPGSDKWEKKSWDWAINRISQLVKETRDRELADGRKVNRIDSIAAIGGAALDNEECYLYSKLMRALDLPFGQRGEIFPRRATTE